MEVGINTLLAVLWKRCTLLHWAFHHANRAAGALLTIDHDSGLFHLSAILWCLAGELGARQARGEIGAIGAFCSIDGLPALNSLGASIGDNWTRQCRANRVVTNCTSLALLITNSHRFKGDTSAIALDGLAVAWWWAIIAHLASRALEAIVGEAQSGAILATSGQWCAVTWWWALLWSLCAHGAIGAHESVHVTCALLNSDAILWYRGARGERWARGHIVTHWTAGTLLILVGKCWCGYILAALLHRRGALLDGAHKSCASLASVTDH